MTREERTGYDAREQAQGIVGGYGSKVDNLRASEDYIDQRIQQLEDERSQTRERLFSYNSGENIPEGERRQLSQRLNRGIDKELYPLIQQREDILKQILGAVTTQEGAQREFDRSFAGYEPTVQGDRQGDWVTRVRNEPESREFARGTLSQDEFKEWADKFLQTSKPEETYYVHAKIKRNV